MKTVTLISAWMFSLAATATGVVGLLATQGKPWLTYGYLVAGAALAFAVLANPLSSALLGLKGRWKVTSLLQLVILGAGIAGVSSTLHQARLHGMLMSEGEYRAAKQHDLALDFQNGTGGQTQDINHAADLYASACAAGVGPSCFNLALMYDEGGSLPHDAARAGDLYEQACAADVGEGCFNRGLQLAHRSDAPINLDGAARAYLRGCDLHHAASCWNLGVMRQKGFGAVEASSQQAQAYFERACSAGYAQACDAGHETPSP